MYPGRGRRPRRPASRRRLRWRPRVRGAPWTSRPTIITWLASCGTLCFPCTPGRGRRLRRSASRWRLRWRPRVRGAPWTSHPTIITCSPSYGTLCSHPDRGRRPRRPASPMASPLASLCARRAVDVAPYHNNMVGGAGTLCSRVSLVGADVPGGPRPDGVSAGVPVCAARRGRRALP